MNLTVHPDPRHPEGGFACLDLPGGSLDQPAVKVSVYDAFGERWLAPSGAARVKIDDPNWQSQPHGFGPYEVERDGGVDRVRIGPEIVNQIEAYMPLRLVVGAQSGDVTWPDDVPPRAGAAALGGLEVIGRAPVAEPAPVPRPTMPEAAPPPPPVAEPAPPPAPETPDAPRPARRLWLPLLLGLAVLAAAVVWLFAAEDRPRAADKAAPDHCTYAALSALPGGYDAIEAEIRTCGADIPADTALRLVEDAAARGEPRALLLFGTLYDGETLDPRVENLIGLTFDDDPARAAEYYDRAALAGSGEAGTRLAAICARLPGSTATLDQGAYDDHCR